MAEKRPSYTSPMPMRAAVDTRLSASALRLIMAVAWHDRMSLMTGTGAGCTAANKTLAGEIGVDYTTLIKLRKHCEETGYFQLEPRQGGKRLEVIRVIPDHLADPKCWPFDQSFIGEGCLKAWHARERKVGETANISAEEVGEIANDDPSKVGEPNSETRGNPPIIDPQYIPLRGERYSSEEGGRDSPEGARFSQTACAAEDAHQAKAVSQDLAPHVRQLKFSTMFAANVLGSQRALAIRSGVQTAYISRARNGLSIPEKAAADLLAAYEDIRAERRLHYPTLTFGEFGYYLPADFADKELSTQLALLEKACKEATSTPDYRDAKESICDFLAEIYEAEDEGECRQRAIRMEMDASYGAYD
jgi:transcriptional regulator with XRE-family HTH domain